MMKSIFAAGALSASINRAMLLGAVVCMKTNLAAGPGNESRERGGGHLGLRWQSLRRHRFGFVEVQAAMAGGKAPKFQTHPKRRGAIASRRTPRFYRQRR